MNELNTEFKEIYRLIVSVASAKTLSDIFTVSSQESIPGTILRLSTETIRIKVIVSYLFASDEDAMVG
jgi:hypothetical protein